MRLWAIGEFFLDPPPPFWLRVPVRETAGPEYLSCVCSWGARFVCKQLSESGICKVGAIAHPSFMNESHVLGVDGM